LSVAPPVAALSGSRDRMGRPAKYSRAQLQEAALAIRGLPRRARAPARGAADPHAAQSLRAGHRARRGAARRARAQRALAARAPRALPRRVRVRHGRRPGCARRPARARRRRARARGHPPLSRAPDRALPAAGRDRDHYPADHFDVYHPPLFERLAADQGRFLCTHLLVAPALAAPAAPAGAPA
jgi:hypothetical protein